MDNKEIMKNFEETFAESKKEAVAPYKASRNLNTAIGNPQMSVNNNMAVNINTDGQIDNTMSTNNINSTPIVETNSEPVTPINVVNETPAPIEPEVKLDITEQPIIKEPLKEEEIKYKTTYISNQNINNTKKKATLTISNEVKIALIICLILFIFILIMPTIADFFRDLRMKMAG